MLEEQCLKIRQGTSIPKPKKVEITSSPANCQHASWNGQPELQITEPMRNLSFINGFDISKKRVEFNSPPHFMQPNETPEEAEYKHGMDVLTPSQIII